MCAHQNLPVALISTKHAPVFPGLAGFGGGVVMVALKPPLSRLCNFSAQVPTEQYHCRVDTSARN